MSSLTLRSQGPACPQVPECSEVSTHRTRIEAACTASYHVAEGLHQAVAKNEFSTRASVAKHEGKIGDLQDDEKRDDPGDLLVRQPYD